MARVPPAKLWNGAKLREFRERSKLSIPETARQVGILPNQISFFETTQTLPALPTLQRIIRALGLDLFDLSELLRLDLVTPMQLQRFRITCRLDGKTPLGAMRELMDNYCQEVKEKLDGARIANRNTK